MKETQVRQPPPHLRELDGIRALAIGLVLLTHLFTTASIVPKAYLSGMPRPFWIIASHGWLGVDLFFVLSGFLITSILLKAKGAPNYFRTFYIRRVLRIVPLYYTVLFVLIAAYGYSQYAHYWNFALGLSANLSSLFGANGPQSAGPMWSLAVEEQFYLFWPLVVFVLSRRRLAVLAIAIVLVEPFLRYHFGAAQLTYPWCRFDGLALGALLALWFSAPGVNTTKTVRLAAGLSVTSIAIAVVCAPFGGFAEGLMSTATRVSEGILIFGALVAIVVALPGLRATAALRSRPARIVADLSFCLYLVHVPLVEAFEFVTHRLLPQVASLSPAILVPVRALTVLTAAFVLATLSRQFLELPFLRLKAVLTPSVASLGPDAALARRSPAAHDESRAAVSPSQV